MIKIGGNTTERQAAVPTRSTRSSKQLICHGPCARQDSSESTHYCRKTASGSVTAGNAKAGEERLLNVCIVKSHCEWVWCFKRMPKAAMFQGVIMFGGGIVRKASQSRGLPLQDTDNRALHISSPLFIGCQRRMPYMPWKKYRASSHLRFA